MAEAATAAAPTGRHQRQLKNYLLDRHFQLKYTGYLVAIAVVLSAALGIILWRTSEAVIAQSKEAVNQGEQVVALGKEVVSESQKVSAVVQMNIVKDEAYADDPALLEAFKGDSQKQDERLKQQQQALEAQAAGLKKQSAEIAQSQRTMFTTLAAVLVLLVLGIGVAGIIVTHRVAGPIFKMKRQIRELGDGYLKLPGKLRKGDELVDFFETFEQTVRKLRARQEKEIEMLDTAVAVLYRKTGAESSRDSIVGLEELLALRKQMQTELDG